MMEYILVITSLRPDECMAEVPAHVFTQLYTIVDIHSFGCLLKISVLQEIIYRSVTTQPMRHKFSIFDQHICCD